MFFLVFTVEGKQQPYVCPVEDEKHAAWLYAEYEARAANPRKVELEVISPAGTPGFSKFNEADLVSVDIYEQLDPKEESIKAQQELISTVERRRNTTKA